MIDVRLVFSKKKKKRICVNECEKGEEDLDRLCRCGGGEREERSQCHSNDV